MSLLRVLFHVGFDLITSCACVYDTFSKCYAFLITGLYQDILIQLISRTSSMTRPESYNPFDCILDELRPIRAWRVPDTKYTNLRNPNTELDHFTWNRKCVKIEKHWEWLNSIYNWVGKKHLTSSPIPSLSSRSIYI